MRFSGFLKETPVCKKKTHHKNIQKSRDKGQKLAQSLHTPFFFFFFFFFFSFGPSGHAYKRRNTPPSKSLSHSLTTYTAGFLLLSLFPSSILRPEPHTAGLMGLNLDPAAWASVDLNEAKEYLTRHDVHILFERLAGNLIQKRPENPAEYLTQRLAEVKQAGSMKVVLVVGIPGSGKSTLCAALSGGADYVDLSSCERDTPEAIQEAVEKISAAAKGKAEGTLLVEGFPRNFAEALALEAVLPPSLILNLHCNYTDAEQRLFRQSQFSDDVVHTVDSIKGNHKHHTEHVAPVVKYYSAKGLVCRGA